MCFEISNNKLIKYTEEPGITDITIPYGVTNICNEAFEYCTSLQRVVIPNSVTSIGDGAFVGCTSLESITVGNSVTNIGDYAFEQCLSLQKINIPNSVKYMGCGTFIDCTSLKNVTINSDNINNIKELDIPSSVIIKCNPDSITDKAAKAAGYTTTPIMTPLQEALLSAKESINTKDNKQNFYDR